MRKHHILGSSHFHAHVCIGFALQDGEYSDCGRDEVIRRFGFIATQFRHQTAAMANDSRISKLLRGGVTERFHCPAVTRRHRSSRLSYGRSGTAASADPWAYGSIPTTSLMARCGDSARLRRENQTRNNGCAVYAECDNATERILLAVGGVSMGRVAAAHIRAHLRWVLLV